MNAVGPVAATDAAAMVRRETAVNTVATAVIAALLTWAIFDDRTAIVALAEPPDGIFGIVPGTFNFTLLVTLALSLVTRRRVAKGLCALPAEGEGLRVGAMLPRNVMLRAVALALVVSAALIPPIYLLIAGGTRLGWIATQWSFTGMLAFFVAYFTALSLIVTPIVVWRALRD